MVRGRATDDDEVELDWSSMQAAGSAPPESRPSTPSSNYGAAATRPTSYADAEVAAPGEELQEEIEPWTWRVLERLVDATADEDEADDHLPFCIAVDDVDFESQHG